MVALTNNKKEETHVIEVLRNNQESLGDQTGIDFLLSTSDLVPIDQNDKQQVMEKIGRLLDKVNPSWLDQEDLKKFDDLRVKVKSEPFDYSDLPATTLRLFGVKKEQPPNTDEGVIMMFPGISLSDGKRVIQLADEIRAVRQSNSQRITVAGESMLMADILNLVFSEAPKVLLISALFIFLIVFYFVKNIFYTLMCLVPAFLTILLTLGFMAMLGIELNYINMLMIPILLGIGVDSGIHMVTRAMEGDNLSEVINETGMAIFGSILTSGLGIGALMLTNHSGLNSLAYVAIIGLSINLLVSILFLPSLIGIKIKRNVKANSSPIENQEITETS